MSPLFKNVLIHGEACTVGDNPYNRDNGQGEIVSSPSFNGLRAGCPKISLNTELKTRVCWQLSNRYYIKMKEDVSPDWFWEDKTWKCG